MVRESRKYSLLFGLGLALFGANEAMASDAEGDRCTSCLEASRLVVPLPCSAITATTGWSLSSPFGVPAAVLPPVLQNWCMLTGSPTEPYPSLPKISAQRPNVFPQSSGFAPLIWSDLHARFLEQSSALQGLPLEEAHLAPVDVAIIDDAWDLGTGEPGDGYRRHGRTLGLMIRELACPDGQHGSCPLYLSNHRALGCDGGRSGTRAQLARAIYEAVGAWQLRESSRERFLESSARLIINLSVGFEDDGSSDTMLVQNAIEVATCHGALVIAAAGNVRPDGSGTGPLFPGWFESRPVPADCTGYALPDPRGFIAAPPARPLVHAASGVEGRGAWLPLLTTRPDGRASIATPAFHAVAGDPLTGSPLGSSEVLTGSSVSAAVTSAVAALIWAYVPTIDPIDVMWTLKASSTPLGALSDFGLNAPEEIGLIGACPALFLACRVWDSPACGEAGVIALFCIPPDPAIVPWQTAMISQGNVPNIINTSGRAYAAPQNCPFDLNLVGPQPGDLGCGACALRASTGTLYIAIDSTYEGDFTPQQVIITDLNDVDHLFDIPPLSEALQAGDQVEVVLNPVAISDVGQARIVGVSNSPGPPTFAPIDWF